MNWVVGRGGRRNGAKRYGLTWFVETGLEHKKGRPSPEHSDGRPEMV
jgi:hypothetical protein